VLHEHRYPSQSADVLPFLLSHSKRRDNRAATSRYLRVSAWVRALVASARSHRSLAASRSVSATIQTQRTEAAQQQTRNEGNPASRMHLITDQESPQQQITEAYGQHSKTNRCLRKRCMGSWEIKSKVFSDCMKQRYLPSPNMSAYITLPTGSNLYARSGRKIFV
jgi:hypothetical protein